MDRTGHGGRAIATFTDLTRMRNPDPKDFAPSHWKINEAQKRRIVRTRDRVGHFLFLIVVVMMRFRGTPMVK